MQVEFVIMLVYSSAEDPGVISDLYHEYWRVFLHSTKIYLTPTVYTGTYTRQRNQHWVKQMWFLPSYAFRTRWGDRNSANILTQIHIPLSMYHDKCCEIKVKNCGRRSGWDKEVQERVLEILKTRRGSLKSERWGSAGMTGESTPARADSMGQGVPGNASPPQRTQEGWEQSVTGTSPKGQLKGDLCGCSDMNLHMWENGRELLRSPKMSRLKITQVNHLPILHIRAPTETTGSAPEAGRMRSSPASPRGGPTTSPLPPSGGCCSPQHTVPSLHLHSQQGLVESSLRLPHLTPPPLFMVLLITRSPPR